MLLDRRVRPFDAGRRACRSRAVVQYVGSGRRSGRGDRLLGGANLCDTHHMTSATPDGSAMRSVMEMALADAGLQPADVAVIKAHGTGSLTRHRRGRGHAHIVGNGLPPFTGIKRYSVTRSVPVAPSSSPLSSLLRAGFMPPTAASRSRSGIAHHALTEFRRRPKGWRCSTSSVSAATTLAPDRA